MLAPISPRLPFLLIERRPGGIYFRDARDGYEAFLRTEHELRMLVAERSSAIGYRGLGDAVRAVTQKLGFGECTPCAKRQAALNARFPRFIRRR
jgi:hypothetical protein